MEYCSVCNLVVAPKDPKRVQLSRLVFHKDCWMKLSMWQQANVMSQQKGKDVDRV